MLRNVPVNPIQKCFTIVIVLLSILFGGNYFFPSVTDADETLPVLSVEKGEYGTYVTIRYEKIPGLVFDIWTYEDPKPGEPASWEKQGNAIIMTHKYGETTVISRFVPQSDGVYIHVRVTGPNADAVKKIDTLNPCCMVSRSPSFRGEGDYVENFVNRCFVFLDKGMTMFKDTARIPGTRPEEYSKANLPKPWIQEYVPAWRKHPGQRAGERGYSTDRPVYPIIGVVSVDRKYLAAVAWPDPVSLGQVWHYCIHPRPVIAESFEPETGEIHSHGKIYLMENDGKKLLEHFKKDFPNWKRPPNAE